MQKFVPYNLDSLCCLQTEECRLAADLPHPADIQAPTYTHTCIPVAYVNYNTCTTMQHACGAHAMHTHVTGDTTLSTTTCQVPHHILKHVCMHMFTHAHPLQYCQVQLHHTHVHMCAQCMDTLAGRYMPGYRTLKYYLQRIFNGQVSERCSSHHSPAVQPS